MMYAKKLMQDSKESFILCMEKVSTLKAEHGSGSEGKQK